MQNIKKKIKMVGAVLPAACCDCKGEDSGSVATRQRGEGLHMTEPMEHFTA